MSGKRWGIFIIMSLKQPVAILEDCGYKIKEVRYTIGVIELPYNSFNNKVLNQLRRITELFGMAVPTRIWGDFFLLVLAE